jgi:hypothetical protein
MMVWLSPAGELYHGVFSIFMVAAHFGEGRQIFVGHS